MEKHLVVGDSLPTPLATLMIIWEHWHIGNNVQVTHSAGDPATEYGAFHYWAGAGAGSDAVIIADAMLGHFFVIFVDFHQQI